jgi:hypothetical protein
MRATAALCVLGLTLLAGCGGGDDRPDLEGSPTTIEVETTPSAATTTTDSMPGAPPAMPVGNSGTPTSAQRRVIVTQADVAGAAVGRWEAALDSCVGPSGGGDDTSASCTRAAWEQLFDQMYSVQYELLDLMGRMSRGPCRETLASALDGVHGFLSGAVPLKVVWLDEQQRPPALFDLEAIVDVARPVAGRMRDAAATTCRS